MEALIAAVGPSVVSAVLGGIFSYFSDGILDSVGSDAAAIIADASLKFVPQALRAYFAGPSKDIASIVQVLRDYGSGKLNLIQPEVLYSVAQSLNKAAAGVQGFNARLSAFEDLGWQLGVPLVQEVAKFNNLMHDVKALQEPVTAAIIALQHAIFLVVGCATLFAVVLMGTCLLAFSRRGRAAPPLPPPAQRDNINNNNAAAEQGRRGFFSSLHFVLGNVAIVMIALLLPGAALLAVFTPSDAVPHHRRAYPNDFFDKAECTDELFSAAYNMSQLLNIDFAPGSTTPVFAFNEVTLSQILLHARGQVTTECRIGQARTSKSTSGTIAARAIDNGPCRHRIYFPMSGGTKSFTQFIDILVTITDDGDTRIMLDFEGFEHLDRTNALVSFALLNCDSLTTHMAGTLLKSDASFKFLEMLDTAVRYYNNSKSSFVRARSVSDLPMHFTLLASTHLDTTASQFQTDLDALIQTKSFAGNRREVTAHFPLDTLAQKQALKSMSVVPGIPKSDFSDRVAASARASLKADQDRKAVAKSLGMKYWTAEEWVARAKLSTKFIEGNLTPSSFADQLQHLYCEKILTDHRARLNEAYEAVATDRRASTATWAESTLRAAWRKHAGSADTADIDQATDLVKDFVANAHLGHKCAKAAIVLRDETWQRLTDGNIKCNQVSWTYDETQWSVCENSNQKITGSCTRDCFSVVDSSILYNCKGTGVKTRECCSDPADWSFGTWTPETCPEKGKKMSQTRDAKCLACGKPATGCRTLNVEETSVPCKYKCPNPAAISILAVRGGPCVKSLVLHSQHKTIRPQCTWMCRYGVADTIRRMDTARGECITHISGKRGDYFDKGTFDSDYNSVTAGSADEINFQWKSDDPNKPCLAGMTLNHKWFHMGGILWWEKNELCVQADHPQWVERYVDCDEYVEPKVPNDGDHDHLTRPN